MPILSISDNPPSKPFLCSILQTEGKWWVAKVKSRQEKAFAFDLLEQNVDYYLPYYEQKTERSDGKIRKSNLVLFTSYVPFITEDPYKFLKQKRVSTILPVKAQKWFREQLNYIDIASDAGYTITPMAQNENFTIGDTVRLISGPCAGLSGKICKVNNNNFLIIQIDALGCIRVKAADAHYEAS